MKFQDNRVTFSRNFIIGIQGVYFNKGHTALLWAMGLSGVYTLT